MRVEKFDSASSFQVEWERKTDSIRCALATQALAHRLTSHWTGARVSNLLIVDLGVAQLCARPVNSGVMSPLRVQAKIRAASAPLNLW